MSSQNKICDKQMSSKWEKQYKFYHSLFKDIPTLSSSELLAKYDIGLRSNDTSVIHEDLLPVIVVDVRSKAERDVSSIPSAMSLKEYEQGIANGSIPNNQTPVVTYCTVGYRSGMEVSLLNLSLHLFLQLCYVLKLLLVPHNV